MIKKNFKDVNINFNNIVYKNEAEIEKVLTFEPFIRWVERNKKNIEIDNIEVVSHTLFNANSGFVYAKLTAKGKKKAGITLVRGDSVAILVVLNAITEDGTENKFSVLTTQYRVPKGDFVTGLPAGMVEGKVLQTLINEMKEEVAPDFEIKEEDFKFLYRGNTSEGVLDEDLDVYYIEKTVSFEELQKYNLKETGTGETEEIVLSVVPFHTLREGDIRTRLAYFEYLYKEKEETPKTELKVTCGN